MPKKSNVRKTKKRTAKPYDFASITTGDIALNIQHFNRRMGTDFASNVDNSGESNSGALTEAKRYVRRYFIRPHNIFCSNKAEIIKSLIDLGDENCSVYTLNNLGDDKDTSKLMTSDIIYYYDDGILYDKNHVKVMDYDLSIKKEENRKHFANVEKTSDKEFKTEYEDRMTDATELEENTTKTGSQFSYSINPFDLDFDAVNVYGECLTEGKQPIVCNYCGEPIGDSFGQTIPGYPGVYCSGCSTRSALIGGL